MGWFDEDDEESDEEEPQTKISSLDNKNEKDDDEEDPLDAYMKSLEDSSKEAATTTANSQKVERLNLLNEEEATQHWQESASVKLPTFNTSADDDEPHSTEDTLGSNNNSHSRRGAAQQALASTFHRAKHPQTTTSSTKEELTVSNMNSLAVDKKSVKQDRLRLWTPSDTHKGHDWRRQHHVTCSLSTDPLLHFSQLSTIKEGGEVLHQAIMKRGFTTPTLVQSQTLPVAFMARDVLVTAATGSGKTMAYVWPMLLHVLYHATRSNSNRSNSKEPLGLVLVPTRELASQVHTQVRTMMSSMNQSMTDNTHVKLKSVCIIGGTNPYALIQELKKSAIHVVVGTPGRLLDVVGKQENKKKKHTLSLASVTMVVLDEADKMLDLGFESQVGDLLRGTSGNRQSILTSATMGKKVEKVAQRWMQPDVVRIAIGRTGASSQHVKQHVMVLPSLSAKRAWLHEMIPILSEVGKTLVFVATRVDCEGIAQELLEKISPLPENDTAVIQTLHGDKHQSDRQAALRQFKKEPRGILVATDVAARGLDVPHVATVISFDPAKNLDNHVHRLGRAGRLSQKDDQQEGTAYTLLTHKNADFAHILVNAFEREGREVTNELRELAAKSRQAGNVDKRTKWNKAGLGFHQEDPSAVPQESIGVVTKRPVAQNNSTVTNGSDGYYGPSSTLPEPPPKRSRWG